MAFRKRKGGGRYKAEPIDTPCGPMTRYHASILSGVAYGTIIRRVWEGRPADLLFVLKLSIRRGPDKKRRSRTGKNWENALTEKWADRKLRKLIAADRS